MKKVFKILILFFILAFNMQSVFSSTLTYGEIENIINLKIKSEFQKLLNTNDFEIKITGIPNTIIKSDKQIKIDINSQGNTIINPNIYKRVVVKTSDGKTLSNFPINIELKVYKKVLTASKNITLNQEITPQNTTLERKDVTRFYDKTLDKLELNYIAKRNYSKGTMILKNSISKKPDITKDSTIDIVFVSKNLSVKLLGKALKSGAIGEIIPVRSEKYNRIYNAKINSQNEVLVRI